MRTCALRLLFVPAHALQAILCSLCSRLFSALGKIEVILCYSVFQVRVRRP